MNIKRDNFSEITHLHYHNLCTPDASIHSARCRWSHLWFWESESSSMQIFLKKNEKQFITSNHLWCLERNWTDKTKENITWIPCKLVIPSRFISWKIQIWLEWIIIIYKLGFSFLFWKFTNFSWKFHIRKLKLFKMDILKPPWWVNCSQTWHIQLFFDCLCVTLAGRLIAIHRDDR